MLFIRRHPVFMLFLVAVAGLTWLVADRMRQPPATEFGGFGGTNNGETRVRVAEVRHETMADRVESVGTSVANESLDIMPKVADTVSKVHFQDGDFVEKGDILVELTSESEATRLAEARASYEDARRQFERLENLVKNNLVAQTELDLARTNMETAEARLEGVVVDMKDRVVRAPIDGVLGFRNVSEGSMVSTSTVITTLDDISLIKLDFTIPEKYLAAVRVGQPIRARSIVYPGQPFEGEIRVVRSRVDPVTRSVAVRAHIDNADARLRPGMLLNVSLDLNEKEALVVPEESVVFSRGSAFVFAVEDGTVQQVDVSVGRRRPGTVEILSGLRPGQQVVTEGVQRVRPGEIVQVIGVEEPVSELSARPADGQSAA